jgi:hypothetical protein
VPVAHHAPPTARRLLAVTPWVAAAGALVALLGLVGLLRPVTTPVQDCGVAAAFLLDGRTNQFANPDAPPDGLTAAEVTANNERPCRDRVADVARPAAIALLVGTAVGIVTAIVEIATRLALRRHRRRSPNPSTAEPTTGSEPGGAVATPDPEPDPTSRAATR